MKQGKYLFILPILALMLGSCDSNITSSSSVSSGTSNISSSTTTSSQTSVVIDEEFILETLQSNISLSGMLEVEEKQANIDVYIDNNEYMLNKNSSDGEKTNIHYFRGSGENSNNVVIQNYNYQNEVIEKLLLDDNNQPISFETFSNPFAFLTIDEIEKESDVFTINLDNVKYLKLFELLTGINDEAESMSISISAENDVLSTFSIVSKSGSIFTANFVDKESIGAGSLSPLETLPEHELLKIAILFIKKGNYKVQTVDVDANDGYQYQNVTAIFTDEGYAVYDTPLAGDVPVDITGYIKLNDTQMGLFSANNFDDNPKGTAEPENKTMDDVRASFDIAPELFIPEGDNSYRLTDKYDFSDIKRELVDYDYYTNRYAQYILNDSFQIKITDRSVSTVIIEFTYVDSFGFECHVTTTLTDIGTTSFPFDVNDYISYSKPTTWNEYSEEIGEALNTMFGDSNLIPFLYTDEWEMSSSIEGIMLDGYFLNSEALSNALNQYCELLIEAGYSQSLDASNLYTKDTISIELETTSNDLYEMYILTLNLSVIETKDPLVVSTWLELDQKYQTNVVETLIALLGENYQDILPAIDLDAGWFVNSYGDSTYISNTYYENFDVEGAYDLFDTTLTNAGYDSYQDEYGYMVYSNDNITIELDISYGMFNITIVVE